MAIRLDASAPEFERAFEKLLTAKRESSVDVNEAVAKIVADVREHGRVGLAALDVERCQPMIERHGLAKTQHELGGTGRESTAPGDLG